MPSDAPPDSPPEQLPPESPFRPAAEQPRLGIIHLLVWTACVAVYFSTTPASYADAPIRETPGAIFFRVASGVASGTALGGLLLLAARRYRRQPFPEQPGETLLVLLGAGVLIHLIGQWLTAMFITDGDLQGQSSRWVVVGALELLLIVMLGVLYVIAIVRTKIPRWRLYFIVIVAANVLMFLVPGVAAFVFGPGGWMIALAFSFPLLALAFLVVNAVRDFVEGMRYRWTHWLGVAVGLWNGAVLAAWAVWCMFFAQWP